MYSYNQILKNLPANLKEELYPIDSSENTIERHISILKGSMYPDLMIIAAHSGIGPIAYFQELNKLTLGFL